MKKYKVSIPILASVEVELEADDEWDAIEFGKRFVNSLPIGGDFTIMIKAGHDNSRSAKAEEITE